LGLLYHMVACVIVRGLCIIIIIINIMGHIWFFIFLAAPLSMLFNGRAFEGTCDYELTDRRLTECTGTSISCIPTFRPVVFPHAVLVHRLLLTFFATSCAVFKQEPVPCLSVAD
jgi:hypothetical protein